MEIMKMVQLQIVFFVLMFVGVISSKRGFITKDTRKNLTDMLLNIILPCSIFVSFQCDIDGNVYGTIVETIILSTAIQIFLFVLSRMCYVKFSKDKQVVLKYSTIVSNSGFIGLSIIQEVYGNEGMMYGSIAMVPIRIFMWSVGLALFMDIDFKGTIKKIITHPCNIAVFLGFICMIGHIKLPYIILKPVTSIGNCNLAVSMILIGSILAEIMLENIINRETTYYSLIRLIIAPMAALLICRIFLDNKLLTGISVLMAGMPAASTSAILAEKYGANTEFAAQCIFVSTIFSLFTIPLLYIVLI